MSLRIQWHSFYIGGEKQGSKCSPHVVSGDHIVVIFTSFVQNEHNHSVSRWCHRHSDITGGFWSGEQECRDVIHDEEEQ